MSEDNFNPIHESKKNLYFPAFKKIPCYYKFDKIIKAQTL